MATTALLLLAIFALAVEGQTKSFPVMFKDFMEAKNGKAKIASERSYGYEQSELQGACLRMLTKDNCADEGYNNCNCSHTKSTTGPSKYGNYDDDIHRYFETDVGCCTGDYSPKHQDVFRLPEDLKVGKCWWTYLYVGYDKVDAGVKLVGTYDVTCEMEEESEKCGEPLCDDLVLHGWGRIYIDWKAAIEGKPTIKTDYSCKYTNGAPVPAPATAKTNPAQVASADGYYEKDEPEYWKGMAVIADGYVQVMSCSKKTLYKEGKMQAVVDYRIYGDKYRAPEGDRDDDRKPIKPNPDQFIAKPYTMDFILRKTGDY